jgi:cytochrome P450
MSVAAEDIRSVPEHVPAELVFPKSLEGFNAELDDPFLAAARLHAGPDIFWAADTARGRPAWVVTRDALMREIFADHETFSAAGMSGLAEMLGVEWHLLPVECDPPLHSHYRMILTPFFTPRAMEAMDGAVREVCRTLIAKFEDRGGCDFIGDFAVPFPTYIFLKLVGMPLDRAPQFLAWEHDLMREADPTKRVAAAKAVCRYLENFTKEQRVSPSTDLLAGIVSAKIEGRPITDTEILAILYTFYVAGLDTVYATLGFIIRHLATHPELQARLRQDLSSLPKAVDDLTRAFSVVGTHRRVARDVVFHGVKMRAGDVVLLPLYLAGRDPERHADPERIDLGRESGRLTFGSGVHTCLGVHLARREIRIALESFLTRFENIRIAPGDHYTYHTGVVFGVDRLPLVWDRPAAA